MASETASSVAWRVVGSVQGIVLIILAVVGLLGAWQRPGPLPSSEGPMLLFDLNPVHALLLLVTGVLSLVTSPWRASLLWFSVAETLGFVVLFLYGTAVSTTSQATTPLALDPAENFLHAGLAIVGFCIMCGLSLMPWLVSQRSARGGP